MAPEISEREVSESVRVTADIPKSLHKRLKVVLAQEERTIQDLILRGLEQFVRFREAQTSAPEPTPVRPLPPTRAELASALELLEDPLGLTAPPLLSPTLVVGDDR